jgi:transcriptional regulator with XRE-family HTH domain
MPEELVVSNESPAVARRRLRLALRRARETKGLTQGQVAERLEWSLSKVQRIESGEVTVSHTDLRAALALLNVADPDQVNRLIEVARAARRRGWWDQPRYREHLSAPTLQLLQFEGEATAIRSYHPMLIPGLLQTRAYAEAVVNFWQEDLSEADRTARLEVRMHRGVQVFDRADAPQYLVLLDESMLLREVGGPRVMAEQLQHAADMNERPEVIIRIVLLPDGGRALVGPFTVLDLGEEENAVLYREADLGDDMVHTSGTVRRYRRIFEQLWSRALTAEASARLIRARAATMAAALDRPPASM